jgi:hypothetical protein
MSSLIVTSTGRTLTNDLQSGIKRLLEMLFSPVEQPKLPRKIVSLGIDETQKSLDMSKEIIETILTHLEVHYPHLVKILPSKKSPTI